MNNNWRWLACFFAVPAFSLFAQLDEQSIAMETEDIAFEQETAQLGKKPPVAAKKASEQPEMRSPTKEHPAKNMQKPEEMAIQSQPTITPPVAPYISEGSDVFATVAFIWWKTAISGTEYAFTGTTDGGVSVPLGLSTGNGRVKTPDMDFQPGVKLGIGVNFEHDGWDLYANYTFLSGPKDSNSVLSSPGVGAGTITDVRAVNGSSSKLTVLSDKSEWNQNFNVIDLELGRNFFVSRFLTMRPHVGFKTAWLLDKGVFTFIPTAPPPAQQTPQTLLAGRSIRDQHMWGLGIRTGMNTGWHVTKKWSFYADFAVTTLWTDFHVKWKDFVTTNTFRNVQTLNTKETFQTVTPVIEAGLGLAYITWWDADRYRFQVQGGWEEQVWIDYNHFMRLGDAGGSLSVHGLTLKAMLTF